MPSQNGKDERYEDVVPPLRRQRPPAAGRRRRFERYWDRSAECLAERVFDDEARAAVWNAFKNGPEPVGYDPASNIHA
jgi:hypothetical protein